MPPLPTNTKYDTNIPHIFNVNFQFDKQRGASLVMATWATFLSYTRYYIVIAALLLYDERASPFFLISIFNLRRLCDM
jgi:hypothetical protein